MQSNALVPGLCLCALAAGCAETFHRPQAAPQPRVPTIYLHAPNETAPEWLADNPHPGFRNCRVDTVDCMDLDSRPFQPCLVDVAPCPRDAERILVPAFPR